MASLFQLLRSESENPETQHSDQSLLLQATIAEALLQNFPMEATGMARSIPWNNLEFEFSEGNQCQSWLRLPYANYTHTALGRRMCDDGNYYELIVIVFIIPDYLTPLLEAPER